MLRIEAWLTAEGEWWAMPYYFDTAENRLAFLDKLRAANPGRTFRAA